MLHTSYIEISRSALEHNLNFIRDFINENVLYSSVIKGNAYGHGIEIIVPLEEDLGVRHFSVFSADEAYRVKKISRANSAIMIMGMLDKEQLTWAIENDIEFFVFNWERLHHATTIANKLGKRAKIHVELETGMNRTGFPLNDLPHIAHYLKQNIKHLSFHGLCTHYAGAESIANYYRVKKQMRAFNRGIAKLKQLEIVPRLFHTACSAALLRYPATQMDMVRVGILQYGFFPSKEVLIDYLTKTKRKKDPLHRIISWKSSVMDIKHVKTGEFIGYGTSYFANTDMKIAIIPVGYGHGFSRSLSNQGRVLINGQMVNVIGMVNMNMMSVNICNTKGVKKGDEVVIIGKQGDMKLTVASFSDFSDQINYELLTRLPSDLPRITVV
ncbi:alanine racemase [Marinilabiliaceae bacterium JC017]|nr:alanine racemase [Marinilabiliaceae bacterium JC017]